MKQHTVSQVVLRQFVQEGELLVYDRLRNTVKKIGPKGAFYLEDFDGHNPAAAENEWQSIESALGIVYGTVQDSIHLWPLTTRGTLLDVLALHWARSPGIKHQHREALDAAVVERQAVLRANRRLAASMFHTATGLVPAGHEALELLIQRYPVVAARSGDELFAASHRRLFNTAREHFERRTLQVTRFSADELLIGDSPVLSATSTRPGLSPQQGIALYEAEFFAMPIQPRLLVGLGPTGADFDGLGPTGADFDGLGPPAAEFDGPTEYAMDMNRMQFESYERWIAAAPDSPAAEYLLGTIPGDAAIHIKAT